MPFLGEVFRGIKSRTEGVKSRVNPEGIAASTAISGVANFAIFPLETGLTAAIHELSKGEPSATRLGAIALSAGLNVWSIRQQEKALRQVGYSADLGGTLTYTATGKPLASATVDHAVNWGLLTVLNPINAAAIYNNDMQLLQDSMIASSLAIPIWNIPLNQAIAQGRADEIVQKIKSLTEQPEHFDYHRYQRNMRNR